MTQHHIEFVIFSLFKINVLNFIKVKATLAKEYHIQPSELDNMPVWEFELFMKEINNAVKEENKRNEQEMEKSGYKDIQKMTNTKHIDRMQKSSMAKANSMGNFKMPTMPKI